MAKKRGLNDFLELKTIIFRNFYNYELSKKQTT